MNSHTRRRDDRSTHVDPFKQWVHTDKYPPDHDSDRRRNRSATVPSNSYDPRSHDARYNDPRQALRSHRQDPHYPQPPTYSYQHTSAHAPPTSKAYQHATRSSAQHPSAAHQHPQPSSYHSSHPTHAYPVASSSRRPHQDAPDPRTSRRPHPSSYDHIPTADGMQRSSTRPSRAVHSSIQPSFSTPANQPSWNHSQDLSASRRHKDPYKDRDRDQDRDRDRERERERETEREKPTAELENRYKDRSKAERHRERERSTDVRYQDSSRSRYHDKRKDSDTEGALHSEQKNASKASLSGREGYSVRDPSNGHRRHRTEDGTTSTSRRHQPENTQNLVTTMQPHSASAPQPDAQQIGEPPSAPRVMPVYLPPKAKPQRSHREARPSTASGAQSGSDTERATGKHRMDRTPSGPAVQRSDARTSTSTRDKGSHDLSTGPRDDVKKPEGKYGIRQDFRPPPASINVDIPLVTPGFKVAALPIETRTSTVPQIVSIRAGQGPSDPHDAHFKSSAISHLDAPQETVVHPPHAISASIVKPGSHTRSHPSETRVPSDRPPVTVEYSQALPHGDDLPPGECVSIHESSRALPTPISKSYSRGNPETGVDVHSRPPSRSAHRISTTVPPVVGPRLARSVSHGPQSNESPPIRPPSVTHYVPTTSSTPGQHSVPPSPAHQADSGPPKAGLTYGSSSAQPSPKHVHPHGVSPSPVQLVPSVPPTVHPTPIAIPQTLPSSRPSTRDGTHTDAQYAHQQSAYRQSSTDNYPEPRQTSNSTTLKASWVVQTPATAKRTRISREEKYLRDHLFNLEMSQDQLRQVLSQDDDPFPRPSSSMMKASQATTPTVSSQRNSPGAKDRDVSYGTPRGTLASNSPKSRSAKETPTLEHVPRQNLSSHHAGPPQISVIGATPVSVAHALPQGRVNHDLLAPSIPAPTWISRTTSSSQDQQFQSSQPVVQSKSSPPFQPQIAPPAYAPSLFHPYQPPSPPTPEEVGLESGQFSPPPLPIPPPRSIEDYALPPVETRTSEIIPTRSQSDEPRRHIHSVPEVESEMFHLPSQPSQPSSAPPPRATEIMQLPKADNNTVPTVMSNGSVAMAHGDTRSSKPSFRPEDVQIPHQDIMRTTSVLPSQSSTPPARPRPKVTVEEVPEDSPVLGRGTPTSIPMITSSVPVSRQPSQHPTAVNAPSVSKPVTVEQSGHKSSPQSRSKDSPLHRNVERGFVEAALPMVPPTAAVAPTPTRVPSSAPPTQPIFPSSSQAVPTQRTTSHNVSSRAYQRATEMLQASKPPAGTGPITTGNVNNKPTVVPIQTTNSFVSTAGAQQLANTATVQGSSASRLINSSTITDSYPSASATAPMTKVTTSTTISSSGPQVGAPGLHTFVPSTGINPQPLSAPELFKHQPTRPAPLSIPSLDATSTTVMPTTAVKNIYQEQLVVDSTRSRDAMSSAARNLPPSSIYPASTRPGPSSATTQQTHVSPAQPSSHHRTVSLPVATSSTVQKPPSPRKSSQPIPSTTVSTQPFPSRPSAPEQSARILLPGHLSAPVPVRSARLSPPDHADSDMLKTPSSIAPSPMLNPDIPNTIPQSISVPIRPRNVSTDSKDDKKKGLFGIFRTRTLSSKAADPPPLPSTAGASLEQERVHLDVLAAPSTTAPMPRGATSTSAPKESLSMQPAIASTSTRAAPQSKFKGRVPDPIAVLSPPTQTAREQKDITSHIFTPFRFLHSRRNRTVSAASLDVCDGNTATNTVVGSPDQSAVSQVQPLPIIPPDVRDPLVATSEWREREEAARRERRTHRVRRPGVTFDLEEEPPSPAPGTANRRKRLARRPSGRAPTPGPPRG